MYDCCAVCKESYITLKLGTVGTVIANLMDT